jgi:alpha-L-rhamnosidase
MTSSNSRKSPSKPRADHRVDAIGVGRSRPRLSWRPVSGATSYEVESAVESTGETWRETLGSESFFGTQWVGTGLRSRERRIVRVRALLADGGVGKWSESLVVEEGLLDRRDWHAKVASAPLIAEGRPVLRRRFNVDAPIATAGLYVTYLGIGSTSLNGRAVTNDVLSPGWQSCQHRIGVSVYDVSHLLRGGENLIEVRLGDGWWAGRVGFNELRSVYGSEVGAIAQLEWESAQGAGTVATDEHWVWASGPTLAADHYDGETHDARRTLASDSDRTEPERWRLVEARPLPEVSLLPIGAPPIRRSDELAPTAVMRPPAGKTVVDFGQNVVGWLRLTVRGDKGTRIIARHAEVLEAGELGVRPLRSAKATDEWILAGTGEDETWEPSFTYHGFRYAEIEGWPGDPSDVGLITAVVIESALPRAGWLHAQHAGIDRLHQNVEWSLRGSFVSFPTDCPQRDERLGWTGNIAVFAPAATFLSDTYTFLSSWLEDVAAEQSVDGVIPYFVPSLPFPEAVRSNPLFQHLPTAVWGDAATLVPTALYWESGDLEILRRCWPMMRRWLDGVAALAGPARVWDQGFQYGDWLDPAALLEEPWKGNTETALVATAYFAHSARLVGGAAALLGHQEQARNYLELHDEVRAAFLSRFLLPGGLLTSDSQSAYSIALMLDLVEGVDRAAIGARLVQLVRKAGHTIGTGFVGTPLVLDALTKVGATEDAFQVLLPTESPSWLCAVDMGATTVWERWDSMLPDGSINPGGMTSFNHYAFGAVAQRMHSTIAGLDSQAPGWSRVRIAPHPHEAIRAADASHETPFGRVAAGWPIEGDLLVVVVEVEVPEGIEAELSMRGAVPQSLSPGRQVITQEWPTQPSVYGRVHRLTTAVAGGQ